MRWIAVVINVSEALDSDTSEIVTVIRKAVGAYIDGIYVEGSLSTFRTICSVQQPTPKELLNLPEGERDKDIRKFISKRPIRATSDRDGTTSDIISYKGLTFKVIQAGDWNAYGYTECYGAREK